jgi:hypothetical protein
MATTLDIQKLADGPKGTIVKVAFVSDGTAQTGVTLVDVANLSGALSNTGDIRVGQANTLPFYRTSIRKIYGQGTFKTGAHVQIKDNANTIAVVGPGQFDMDFDVHGGGSVPANGSITLTSAGIGANDAFTLIIVLKKDPRDFTMGQHADPSAFNSGRFTI